MIEKQLPVYGPILFAQYTKNKEYKAKIKCLGDNDVEEDLLGEAVLGLGDVVRPDHLVVSDPASEEGVLDDLVVRGAAAHLNGVRLGPGRPGVAHRLGPHVVRPDSDKLPFMFITSPMTTYS